VYVFHLVCLHLVTIALQWQPTPKDGDVIYACEGDDVTFHWVYTLSPGEEITSTEWLFRGISEEIVAFLTHGIFAPGPTFSGRVQQQAANGSIVLKHLATGDSGNFTIEINEKVSGTYRRTVILRVSGE
jgi:hypothetical protein